MNLEIVFQEKKYKILGENFTKKRMFINILKKLNKKKVNRKKRKC